MNEVKFTKGHWRLKKGNDDIVLLGGGDDNWAARALLVCNKYDAALIATAPEMYYCIEMCRNEFTRLGMDMHVEMLEGTLARARGEDNAN